MKRIFAILMVALFMVSVMVVSTSIAFADPDCTGQVSGRSGGCKITDKGQGRDTGSAPDAGSFVGPKHSKNPEHR